MESEKTNAPTYYNSLYKHGVDEKRRVQIPAKWRPSEPNVEFTLIVWPKSKEGPCLRALPPKQMAALMRDIDAMPNSDPGKVVLKRFIGSESIWVGCFQWVDRKGLVDFQGERAAQNLRGKKLCAGAQHKR